MEVWITLKHMLRSSKNLSHIDTHKSFQTCSIKGFSSVFKAMVAPDSFNTWINFENVKPVVPQMFVKTIFFMTYFYVFMHSFCRNEKCILRQQ